MKNQVQFKRLGTMIDCSRNAVMNVKTLKKWIDLTADLGYNTLCLYMEDTYEWITYTIFLQRKGESYEKSSSI